MKTPFVLLALAAAALTGCSHPPKPTAPTAAASGGKSVVDGKTAGGSPDDLDTYSSDTDVADPIQPVNRVTFWINHQLYVYALRPVSKGYEFIVPEKGREAVYNAFENIKFPVRFVNKILQADLPDAGRELGKFVVNSTAGVGGLGRPAEHIPALANVSPADTGQTFAKWGIPNGFYLVLPVLGPTTLRDGVGLAGDYVLNPITWGGFIWGGYGWFVAIPAANTMRALPIQLAVYDAATKDSIDRYLAARSAYIQYRKEFNSR
jgi:phospholipid-binding lipoprotein MlaA